MFDTSFANKQGPLPGVVNDGNKPQGYYLQSVRSVGADAGGAGVLGRPEVHFRNGWNHLELVQRLSIPEQKSVTR